MKLAILDKDGSLVSPASGATFPQHPQDQALLPGVEKAVARLVADGYTLVIASNQGGCDVQTIPISEMKGGQYWHDASIGGLWQVKHVIDRGDRFVVYGENEVSDGGEWNLSVPHGSTVKVSWKTIEDTIAEMRYCLELLPAIQCAYFCPDFAGDECFIVSKSDASSRYGKMFRPYRKPHPGMLKAIVFSESTIEAPEKIVMIGDQDCDRLAAEAAGILFLYAAEWRNGVAIPA